MQEKEGKEWVDLGKVDEGMKVEAGGGRALTRKECECKKQGVRVRGK